MCKGAGDRIKGVRFEVWDSGFRVQGLGVRVRSEGVWWSVQG